MAFPTPSFTVVETADNAVWDASSQFDLTVTVPSNCKTLIAFVSDLARASSDIFGVWDVGGVAESIAQQGTVQDGTGWGRAAVLILQNPTPGASKTLRIDNSAATSGFQFACTIVGFDEVVTIVSNGGASFTAPSGAASFDNTISGITTQAGDAVITCLSDDGGTTELVAPGPTQSTGSTYATQATGGGDSWSGAGVTIASGSSTSATWNYSSHLGAFGDLAVKYVVLRNASDATAPVLSSPTGTATGSTTANVGATTDEANGTMYAVVTTSATQPTVAQIKAGQDHTGAAAVWGGNQAISSAGAKTFDATGLTAATAYYGHLVHTDAATNDSNRVSSAQFTTDASSWHTSGTGRRTRAAIALGAIGIGPILTGSRRIAPATGVFTYAGSGTIQSSGSGGKAKAKAFLGSGTVQTSGSALLAKVKAFLGSGTVQSSGAGGAAKTKSFAGAGTVQTSGSAILTKGKAYQGAGTVQSSGAAATLFSGLLNKQYAGSGTVQSSGAAILTKIKAFLGSGTIQSSGSGAVAKTKTFLGSGTIQSSGAALLAKVKAFLGVGTIQSSGSAVLSKTKAFAGAGTVQSSGSGGKVKTKVYQGAGTVQSSGGAILAKTKVFAGAGTIQLSGAGITSFGGFSTHSYIGTGLVQSSGAAGKSKDKVYQGAGTVQMSGAGATSFVGVIIRSYTGSGLIQSSGVAPHARSKSYLPQGVVTVSGTFALAKGKVYVTSGTIIIFGAGVTRYVDGSVPLAFALALVAEQPARKWQAQNTTRSFDAQDWLKRNWSAQ